MFRERLGRVWTRWPDAILVAGGSNVTQVYLREGAGGWSPDGPAPPRKIVKAAHLPDVAGMARDLAEYPGIAQVFRPGGEGDIDIFASDARSSVVMVRGGKSERLYAYVVPEAAAGDPLDYLQDRYVSQWICREGAVDDACFHSQDAWLERTAGAKFPGAVGLLDKALLPERFTGDLVLTARHGYTFLKGQKGDHGNLHRDAMTTPFVLNGPGVVPGGCADAFVRLVDLYPTAAVLLGADPHDPALESLDGRPLECVRGPRP
jgi:hypothetical protein